MRAALKAIASREAEVALFTSASQVVNVMQMAEADGISAEVRRGFASMAVGSIGPVCSAEWRVTEFIRTSSPSIRSLVIL